MTECVGLGFLFAVSMPYPAPFSYEESLIIEEAIREGLRRAFLRKPALRQAPLQEVDITAGLEEELSSMMEDESEPVRGFTSNVFETIVRGGELRDWRGMKLEKRPDLVFRRKKRPRRGMDFRYFGLFVECKVVGAKRVMYPYVQEGLRRITDGTYAWAVPLALMVAYVEGGYKLPKTLGDYLGAQPIEDPLVSKVFLRDGPTKPAIYSTVHARKFQYEDGGIPGDIRVDHLWYYVRPSSGQLELFEPG